MLKTLLLLCAVTLIVVSPSPSLGAKPQDTASGGTASKNPVKPTPESQAKAKKIYAVDCALCHGEKGDGKTDLAKDMGLTLDDWTDGKTLTDKPDSVLFDTIRKGKGKMPEEGAGRAKDDEVWNLIIYIRRLAADQAAKPGN